METTYYLKVNIESAGTEYTRGGLIPKSLAGHMWYEIYQKDSNGNIIPASGLNAGYTGDGIVPTDAQNYAGDPAYSSNEIAITQEQFNTLFEFGTKDSALAAQHGFGSDDYNVLTNSCIDYVWKGLELAGINDSAFQGDLMPRWNRDDLDRLLGTGTYNDYHKLTLSERQGLAYQIANGDLSGILYGAYNPNNSFVPVRRYDPLILDLNGDGVKTISQQTSKTFFDLSGDGMSEQTGWVDSNDGLLVYDKNGNGKIDDISELFGNANQSGFSELKQLFDANNDNLIDDKDINFSQLKVWQDINGDGISQENELKSLDELGITSINLKATSTSIDSNGNTIKATSTFTQNGEIKQIADVDLNSSKMLTDYTKDYNLTIDSLILPWLRGYGTVKDAHILYSIDNSFVDFTKTFLQKDLKRSFIKFINNSRFYKADFLI